MTIRVKNLPPQVTEADLTQLFLEYGSIEETEIFETEHAASVTLNGEQEEESAISALNGTEWRGNILELELESSSRDRSPADPPPDEPGGDSSERGVGDPPPDEP